MDSCQITTGLWITEGCVGERKPLEVTVQHLKTLWNIRNVTLYYYGVIQEQSK